MLVIVQNDSSLEFAADWIDPHIQHELRNTMDLASVISTLGLVNENQVSTSGTIKIMKELARYRNRNGVSRVIQVLKTQTLITLFSH